MAPQLKISQNLIDKLGQVKSESAACLYGIMYDGNLLVVGIKLIHDEIPKVPISYPTEIDLCGVVGFGSEKDLNDPVIAKILKEVDITDNPLIINCPIGDSSGINVHFRVHDRLENTTYEIVSESDIWKQFVHLRLKTRLLLVCDCTAESIEKSCSALHKKFVSGQVSFHFPKGNVHLMGTDPETGLSGITGQATVGELTSDSTIKQVEGSSSRTKNKKTSNTMEILDVDMFWKPTFETALDDATKHAPIINHNKKKFKCLQMYLKIDMLSMVYRQTKVVNLYNILIESLCRSLKLNEQSLLNQITRGDYDDPENRFNNDLIPSIKLPTPYHFIPKDCGHFITIFYPKDMPESLLENERKILHTLFVLPLNRPMFRQSNAYMFNEDYTFSGKLINPHDGINSQVKGGETSLVQGKYVYYHYMQDNFNDDGWGCAYRSLQTLCSWFWFQGYSTKPVPTHKEIQELLVAIGDKPSSFINSRQWIGSTEVSFYLDTALGIQSRIINVNSGTEIASLGPQLSQHFKVHGTPIMIGGGVLAHTIIGVDFNKYTDEIKFLILDPHFKGADDVHQVQNKGGCAWKGVDFWKKGAYYNLCLPQLPNFI